LPAKRGFADPEGPETTRRMPVRADMSRDVEPNAGPESSSLFQIS
jgi:hypothetical protein